MENLQNSIQYYTVLMNSKFKGLYNTFLMENNGISTLSVSIMNIFAERLTCVKLGDDENDRASERAKRSDGSIINFSQRFPLLVSSLNTNLSLLLSFKIH